MQLQRLFEIVYILLNKKSVTAKELAERFEVSVRTIYRDIDTLSSAGIPIYATQGKGGGVSLLEDYVLDKSLLSEQEQNEILYALQSLTITQAPEADKVLAKLVNLFQKDNTDWIEVDFSPWGSDQSKADQFSLIKNAILRQQIIEFNYHNSSGEKSRRKVESTKLIFKVNAWYLQGFCLTKNSWRLFKISRMSDVELSHKTFTPRAMGEFPEYNSERNSPHSDSEEQQTQKWVQVRLMISAPGTYRVYDEFEEEEISKNADGSFMISASLPESQWLIRYLLSFGADLEVLSPPNIREILHRELSLIMNKYSKIENDELYLIEDNVKQLDSDRT